MGIRVIKMNKEYNSNREEGKGFFGVIRKHPVISGLVGVGALALGGAGVLNQQSFYPEVRVLGQGEVTGRQETLASRADYALDGSVQIGYLNGINGNVGEKMRVFSGDFRYLSRIDGSRLEGIQFGDFDDNGTLDLKYSDGEVWYSLDRR